MRLFERIKDLLFPEKCVLCKRILEKSETDLCRHCRVTAPEHPLPKTKREFLKSWTAVWYYQDHVRDSILRYKFRGYQHYAGAYGRMLGMKILRDLSDSYDVLTWVPISAKRRRKRGYDQVELLAGETGKELGMEPIPLLRKVRDNPPQSGFLGAAERRANVLGVYEVLNRDAFMGKRVLLLDDVITTGATAGECARMLLVAGAKEVHCAVLAAAHHQNKTSR